MELQIKNKNSFLMDVSLRFTALHRKRYAFNALFADCEIVNLATEHRAT